MTELEKLCEEALYQEIRSLEDGKSLVMETSSGKLYFKKRLSVYSIPVFSWLKTHPDRHIPLIQAFWQDGEELVVIEELIQGMTLEQLLEEQKPDFSEKKRILMEICDALIFLHGADPPIIHRDLKSSNVMLTEDGIVKLIDYDAAKVVETSAEKDTVQIGTPGIAAPEQYGFAPSDARTDIYALGRLLDHLLPHHTEAAKIADRATRMEPKQRFSSVLQMRRQIERLKEQQEEQETGRKRIPGFGSKKKGIRILSWVLTGLAAAAVIFCVYRFYWIPETTVRRPAYEAALAAQEAGEYREAVRQYEICGEGYRDAASRAEECRAMMPKEDIRKIGDAEAFSTGERMETAQHFSHEFPRESLSEEDWKEFREAVLLLFTDMAADKDSSQLSGLQGTLKAEYGQEEFWRSLRMLAWTEASLSSHNLKDALWALGEVDTDSLGEFREKYTELQASCRDYERSRINHLRERGDVSTANAVAEQLTLLPEGFPGLEELRQEYLDALLEGAEVRMKMENYNTAAELFAIYDQQLSSGVASADEETKKEAYYRWAEALVNAGDAAAAAEKLDMIPDDQEAAERALQIKEQYCLDTADDPQELTYTYIEDLIAAGRPGAEELKARIETWHAEVACGLGYMMGSMQGFAITADLSGGPKDAAIHLSFTIRLDDGTKDSYQTPEEYSAGDTVEISYTNSVNPSYNLLDRTYTINVYDDDGNLIGSTEGSFAEAAGHF